MIRIDFNDASFKGFEDGEDVLLDTGLILAFLNKYDSWHKTVAALFDTHIIGNDNAIFLYVNPTLVNEVTFLSKKPMEQYSRAKGINFTDADYTQTKRDTVAGLRKLIEDEVIIVLEGNKNSVLKQLSICEMLGDADAVYASIANEYGISFLTVDGRLVNNLFSIQDELPDIRNVYYTTSKHREY
jgi:predicted nucleic acid-binding protein